MSEDDDSGSSGSQEPLNPETEPLLDGQQLEKGLNSDSSKESDSSDSGE